MKGLRQRAGLAVSAPLFVFGILAMTRSTDAQQPGPDPRAVARLGKALFFDTTLSNPAGMACATCHAPEAGFSYPESQINLEDGTVPGVIVTRSGNRKPPTVSYSQFIPEGLPHLDAQGREYVGGLFYDGRTPDLPHQAAQPLQNPNEMNDLVHNVGSPALVVSKVANGPNAALFKTVYGPNVFTLPTAQVFALITQSIAAWEHTPEVSPFNSKYDAFVQGRATFTQQELNGLRLFTGSVTGRPGGTPFVKNAQCSNCHSLAPAGVRARDLFTNSHYVNIGIPRNSNNPFYPNTNAVANPAGYNPLGFRYVDFGLGDFLYPLNGLPNGDLAQQDPLAIDGTFKTPTLRNVDKRPTLDFVKAYGHNGVFKSLKQVVHFYNTRNLTTQPGEVIDFTKPNPYAGLIGKPLWPTPEVPSPKTLINPRGLSSGPDHHIGNLGLTPQDEDALVAFLRTLSDGFFTNQGPPPPPPPPPGP